MYTHTHARQHKRVLKIYENVNAWILFWISIVAVINKQSKQMVNVVRVRDRENEQPTICNSVFIRNHIKTGTNLIGWNVGFVFIYLYIFFLVRYCHLAVYLFGSLRSHHCNNRVLSDDHLKWFSREYHESIPQNQIYINSCVYKIYL